jgi:hypothetical protein
MNRSGMGPNMKWEDIVNKAARVACDTNADPIAAQLAVLVLDFHRAMAAGRLGLPRSWEPAAIHLAGYEARGAAIAPEAT